MKQHKRVYINIVFNFIYQIVNFFYKILLTPFLLNSWGAIKYGEWLSLFSFITSLTLLNFGIAKYYGNNLRKSFVNSKFQEYRHSLSELMSIISYIIIIAIIILFILTSNMNFNSILNIIEWSSNQVTITVILLGMSIVLNMSLEIISSLYVSIGKYFYQPMILSLNILAQIIFIIISSFMNVSIVEVAFIIFFISLALNILFYMYFFRTNSQLKYDFVFLNLSRLKESFFKSSYFQLITLSQFAVLQGSVILLSSKHGGLSVTIFVVARTITTSLGRQITQVVNHGVWPELTTLFAQKEFNKLRYSHRSLFKISQLVIVLFVLNIFIFIEDIYILWLGDLQYLDYQIIFLLMIVLFIQHLWIPSSFFPLASNNAKVLSILLLLNAITFLFIGNFIIDGYGIKGLLISMIISDIVFLVFFIPMLTSRMIEDKYFVFLLDTVIKTIFPIISMFLLYYYFGNINLNNFIDKMLLMIILNFIILLYFWTIVLSEKEKEHFISILLKMKSMMRKG